MCQRSLLRVQRSEVNQRERERERGQMSGVESERLKLRRQSSLFSEMKGHRRWVMCRRSIRGQSSEDKCNSQRLYLYSQRSKVKSKELNMNDKN